MATATLTSDPCVSLHKGTLVRPVPRYPSSVATDAALKIAANEVTTTLIGAVSPGDSLFRVSDTSRLVVDMLLTIDSEIVSVSAIDTSAGIVTVTRGFDGTIPSAHNAGRLLAAYIDAWHHNALAAEVMAIEAALGPNLSNVVSDGGIVSSAYNWAQSLSGNLIVGNNSITLTPVPKGVNGSNTDHWLYISGGTGTAEAVLITGGSAVSGAASGTIIVNCAGAHSGSWTIGSATAGIQEALRSISPLGAEIRIPAGPFTIQAPITVDVEGTRITGETRNPGSGLIRTSGIIFDVTAGTVEITALALAGGAVGGVQPAPAGNIGIRTTGVRGMFHNLTLNLLYGGVLNAGGHHNIFRDLFCRNFSGYVVKHSDGVSPFIGTVTYATDTGFPVPAEGGIVINADGAYVYDCDILHAYHGVVVQPIAKRLEWTFLYNVRADQCYANGFHIFNGSPYELDGVFLNDCWSASSGLVGEFGGLPASAGSGLVVTNAGAGSIKNVFVTGGQIFNSCDANVAIHGGRNISLDGVLLPWANGGDGPNIDNIYVNSPDRVEVINCTIGSNLAGATALRSGVFANSATGDLLVADCRFVTDNGAYSSDQPIYNLATVQSAVRTRGFNTGVDDVPSVSLLAASATVGLSVRQYFPLYGAATISTFTPAWQGRTILITNADPGVISTSNTGNIQTALTLNEGESAMFTFIGTRWVGVK